MTLPWTNISCDEHAFDNRPQASNAGALVTRGVAGARSHALNWAAMDRVPLLVTTSGASLATEANNMPTSAKRRSACPRGRPQPGPCRALRSPQRHATRHVTRAVLLLDRGHTRFTMVRARESQQAYLATQVDPVLKPLIRKAVKGKEAFPVDFRLWLHEALCREYNTAAHAAQSIHPMRPVPEAIQHLTKSLNEARPALAALEPSSFANTNKVFDELCSKASELEQQYAKDCAAQAQKRAEEKKAKEAIRARAAQKKKANHSGKQVQIFLSYARGVETTRFARTLKNFLEQNSVTVWMDEQGIKGGADFMRAIGEAIESSDGIVAIVDAKYTTSTYCNNEIVMAQGTGLQIFPVMYREMSFDKLPSGLKYMLSSINCITQATDQQCMEQLLSDIQTTFRLQPVKRKMLPHGNVATDELAKIALAVPELPVPCHRPEEIIAMLRTHLLAPSADSSSFTASSNKVLAHGQGGVGKTMTAAMVVHDLAIRKAYDRIAWVSLGQTPNIVNAQRELYTQLTGFNLAIRDDATPESQLEQMHAADSGQRWLIVLDDVWERQHELYLNCVEHLSHSSILCTTRIRNLLPTYHEIQLNLLNEADSVHLLLETGNVQATDAAAAAAAKIARACEYLPLYISILGGVISQYEGDDSWETELVDELKKDRVGVIEGEAGEGVCAMVIDTSLKTVSSFVHECFSALGVCPEDIWLKHDVVQLICGVDRDVLARGKVTKLSMRKVIKRLLDLNLLQGSVQGGVKQHDMVRQLARDRIGDRLQSKQRDVVQAFVAAYPKDIGWDSNSVMGQYARNALSIHMREAIHQNPLEDTLGHSWLDAGNDLLTNTIVRSAAAAFGHAALTALGQRHEAEGALWQAAKRYYSSLQAKVDTGELVGPSNIARESLPVCHLLEKAQQTAETRKLEFVIRVLISRQLQWGSSHYDKNMSRYMELMEKGIEAKTPQMHMTLAKALFEPLLGYGGALPATVEKRFNKLKTQQFLFESAAGVRMIFNEHLRKSFQMVSEEDPIWLAVAYRCINHASFPNGRRGKSLTLSAEFCPHSLLNAFIKKWEFKDYRSAGTAVGVTSASVVMGDAMTAALLWHGDLRLAQQWLTKICELFERFDIRNSKAKLGEYAVLLRSASLALVCQTNSYMMQAGLGALALRLMKSLYATFEQIDDTASVLTQGCAALNWTTKTHCYLSHSFLKAQMKRRHFLLAPSEVDEAAMLDWLDAETQAAWGCGIQQGGILDIAPSSFGGLAGGDAAEVYEKFHRYDDAIEAAQADIRHFNHYFAICTQSYAAIGRCQAAKGNHIAAAEAFNAAIDSAHRSELPFLEMLTRRDYIVCVLDKQDRRESQMAALGSCINRMVLPADEYSPVLGSGFDAAAAVATFKNQKQ